MAICKCTCIAWLTWPKWACIEPKLRRPAWNLPTLASPDTPPLLNPPFPALNKPHGFVKYATNMIVRRNWYRLQSIAEYFMARLARRDELAQQDKLEFVWRIKWVFVRSKCFASNLRWSVCKMACLRYIFKNPSSRQGRIWSKVDSQVIDHSYLT